MTIAYIRTYSNKQQTESQKNAIEQFAKAKKIEIDKWLKDAKNSSKEKNRLEDVIKNLQEGDILIVADVTRLSRKLMEIMHLILLCIEKKVALYCIKEGYSFEDNVNSKTLAFTFGLVSEIESKLISARRNKIRTSFGKPQNRISPFPEKPDRKRIERRKCNICRISRLL